MRLRALLSACLGLALVSTASAGSHGHQSHSHADTGEVRSSRAMRTVRKANVTPRRGVVRSKAGAGRHERLHRHSAGKGASADPTTAVVDVAVEPVAEEPAVESTAVELTSGPGHGRVAARAPPNSPARMAAVAEGTLDAPDSEQPPVQAPGGLSGKLAGVRQRAVVGLKGVFERLLGKTTVTRELPFAEVTGEVFGLEVGITLSHVSHLHREGKRELVYVTNPDGSSNIELVLGAAELWRGQRLELQGPALNTHVGALPVGVRLLGLGLTGDFPNRSGHALSYTAEVKATDRTLATAVRHLAPVMLAKGAALAGSGGAHAVADLLAGAVPVVSTALAVRSTRKAIKTLRDPEATRRDKVLAVTRSIADATRVVHPMAGTLAHVAITAVDFATTLIRARLAVQRANAAGAKGAT